MNGVVSWIEHQPILVRIAPVLAALVAYMFARGIIDGDTANLVIAIVGALAGTGGVASAHAAVKAPPFPTPPGPALVPEPKPDEPPAP